MHAWPASQPASQPAVLLYNHCTVVELLDMILVMMTVQYSDDKEEVIGASPEAHAPQPNLPGRSCCIKGRVRAAFQTLPLSLCLPLQEEQAPVGAERRRGIVLLQGRKGRQEELAKLEAEAEEPGGETAEQRNKFLVLRLYEALHARDHAAVQALLAPDLEWWFHGPPRHQQHMMRLLTTTHQSSSSSSFRFVPRSVDAFGSTVIAESQPQPQPQQGGGVYWVHAWTVAPDGVITQLREYFDTDLTVARLAATTKCVWQSRRPDSNTNSLPGLLLAI